MCVGDVACYVYLYVLCLFVCCALYVWAFCLYAGLHVVLGVKNCIAYRNFHITMLGVCEEEAA